MKVKVKNPVKVTALAGSVLEISKIQYEFIKNNVDIFEENEENSVNETDEGKETTKNEENSVNETDEGKEKKKKQTKKQSKKGE